MGLFNTAKSPVGILLCLGCALFCFTTVFKSYKEVSEKNKAFDAHETLIQETNDCLNSGDWNCAEKNLRALLKENPEDQNLQLHLAGILFEQERYDECIAYVVSRSFESEDLEVLKKKSILLQREMEELRIEKSMHFRVEFEGSPSRNDILEALSVLEVAYDSLCRLFDFYPENKMHLVLYQSSEYQGVGPRPDWVGAIYDGKLRVPVGVMAHREIYRPMLFHELTHAFIRAMTRASVPLWLNEGLAQVVDGSRTGLPRPEGSVPTIDALTGLFVKEKNTDQALKLYWYSQKMVEHLLNQDVDVPIEQRFQKLKTTIQDLKVSNVDEILQKKYGTRLEKLLLTVSR